MRVEYGVGDTILALDLDVKWMFRLARDDETVSCVHSVTVNFDLEKYVNCAQYVLPTRGV